MKQPRATSHRARRTAAPSPDPRPLAEPGPTPGGEPPETREPRPDDARGVLRRYITGLIGVCLVLGLLHVLFADFEQGGTAWFDLDKERNPATWWSGMLFAFVALAAAAAFAVESSHNRAGKGSPYRLPVLWLGVALVALWMSLDEITILHENLFWREVRVASSERSDAWKYLTQWQIVFAPGILFALCYMIVFFTNRFSASPGPRSSAFAGLGAWVGALLLEGLRGSFQRFGSGWYAGQVVVEEMLEMTGAVLLFSAVAGYVIDALPEGRNSSKRRPAAAERLLSRRALVAMAAGCGTLLICAGAVWIFAQRQATAGDPIPGLFRRAVAEGSAPPQQREMRLPEFPAGTPPEIWFEDLTDQPLPPLADRIWAGWLTARLLGTPVPPAARLAESDRAPRIVAVSVGTPDAPARSFRGLGNGLSEALGRALEQAGFRPGAPPGPWIRIDLVDRVDPDEKIDFRPPLAMELGIHGLAFSRLAGIAILPGAIYANHMVTEDLEIRPRNMLDWIRATDPAGAERFTQMLKPGIVNPYRFFTTRGFFFDGATVAPLYRGHRTWETVTPDQLLEAARLAGDYLVSVTGEDGQFLYAVAHSTGETDAGYNMLRHAGTIYSMVELYEVTGDERLLAAVRRALGFMRASIRPCPPRGAAGLCLIDGDSAKLGGNALAAIAIARYTAATGDPAYRDLLAPLAAWMTSLQDGTGRFTVHKWSWPAGAPDGFVSAYYPGEAILALVRVYNEIGNAGLLDAASAAAHWLIGTRDSGLSVEELSHDHWLLYGLNDLYRARPDPVLLDHTRRIVSTIVASQNREPEQPDWLGSFYRPPRSTPTAIRSEGLAAAHALLRDFGRPGETGPILQAIDLGVRFQLQTQQRPESVMDYPQPRLALGGFRKSLTDDEVRIDYVQHNISALLALRAILEE